MITGPLYILLNTFHQRKYFTFVTAACHSGHLAVYLPVNRVKNYQVIKPAHRKSANNYKSNPLLLKLQLQLIATSAITNTV